MYIVYPFSVVSSQLFDICIIQPLDKMDEFGIASFGVSITTLEEVFIKVGEGAEKTVDDL